MESGNADTANADRNQVVVVVDEKSRRKFIVKVCALVFLMLMITSALVAVPFCSRDFRAFLIQHEGLVYVALGLYVASTLVLVCCCQPCMLLTPCNIVLMAGYALVTGLMLMYLSVAYTLYSVAVALVVTMVCVLAVVGFACTCKHDLTSCYFMLFILSIVLSLFALASVIICLFVPPDAKFWISMVLSGAFVCYYMFSMAVTIQSIVGGTNRQVVFDEVAYAPAALMVYIDLVGLFLNILRIVGGTRD